MKTRVQKSKEIKAGEELLAKNKTVIFADFSGVSFEQIKRLKNELKKAGGVFKVVKKRLLRLVFKNLSLDFDPTQFDSQVGIVAIPGELSSGAGMVYKFSKELAKEKKEFKLLGAYEIPLKNFLNAEQFLAIAKLPPREVLLAQLVGVLSGPIRALMYIIDQLSKRSTEAQASNAKVAS